MSTSSNPGITREEALGLLRCYLKNEKMISHSLASEAIMRSIAKKLGEDPEIWGIAGLLHDLDYELVNEDPSNHGVETSRILEEKEVSPEIIDAIRMHNAEGLGLVRSTLFEHALTCAETITGMIVATALVYPDKKVAGVKVKSVTKRMKTKHFARAVSRERIMECEKIGLNRNDFIAFSLEAMKAVAEDIGL